MRIVNQMPIYAKLVVYMWCFSRCANLQKLVSVIQRVHFTLQPADSCINVAQVMIVECVRMCNRICVCHDALLLCAMPADCSMRRFGNEHPDYAVDVTSSSENGSSPRKTVLKEQRE